jgi:hypothetical protein
VESEVGTEKVNSLYLCIHNTTALHL